MRRPAIAARIRIARIALVVTATLIAATLVACGGGSGDKTPDTSPTAPAYDLILIAQSCDSAADGSVVASGTARVSGDADLSGAIVLGTFYNEQGAQVTDATSPLPAGANGLINFSVRAPNSPDITRCVVRFSNGNGDALLVDYSAVQLPPDALTPGAATTPAAGTPSPTPPPGTPAGAAPPAVTPAQ